MSARPAEKPIAYGIDFGTTNSSIAVAYPGRVEVVPVETGSMAEVLSSIVYLHRDRNRAVGREAVEQFLVTGAHRRTAGTASWLSGPMAKGPATADSIDWEEVATTPGWSPG
jgi:hypothetical chaperone protein